MFDILSLDSVNLQVYFIVSGLKLNLNSQWKKKVSEKCQKYSFNIVCVKSYDFSARTKKQEKKKCCNFGVFCILSPFALNLPISVILTDTSNWHINWMIVQTLSFHKLKPHQAVAIRIIINCQTKNIKSVGKCNIKFRNSWPSSLWFIDLDRFGLLNIVRWVWSDLFQDDKNKWNWINC